MQVLLLFTFSLFSLACADKHEISDIDTLNKETKSIIQFKLSSKLNEISGLCLSEDNRLFAHNDEKGVIYQINTNSGEIIKSFSLGNILTVNQDFEGIAYADQVFYLISSDGLLYSFKEGKDKEKVAYTTIDLRMNSKFDVEGLCFDPTTNSLLVACKDYPGKNYDGSRAVYSFQIDRMKLKPEPIFLISLKKLKNDFGIKDFYPSAIEKSVNDKSYYILSSRGNPCLVHISDQGEILNAVELSKKYHRQPEGLAILDDGTLIISDEADGKKPTLTLYKNNPLNRK